LRGSTSLEKLILRAARDYAAIYGVDAGELFDIQLEGTSVGIRAAREDSGGSVIALASAAVADTQVTTLTVALDALAVIVHPENPLNDLSLSSLYRVFSGEVRYFDELEGAI
jgi:phosphate transport system substrate-binding protein